MVTPFTYNGNSLTYNGNSLTYDNNAAPTITISIGPTNSASAITLNKVE